MKNVSIKTYKRNLVFILILFCFTLLLLVCLLLLFFYCLYFWFVLFFVVFVCFCFLFFVFFLFVFFFFVWFFVVFLSDFFWGCKRLNSDYRVIHKNGENSAATFYLSKTLYYLYRDLFWMNAIKNLIENNLGIK